MLNRILRIICWLTGGCLPVNPRYLWSFSGGAIWEVRCARCGRAYRTHTSVNCDIGCKDRKS